MRTLSILILFLGLMAGSLSAQSRWSVDPTFRNLYGPSNTAIPLHHFIQANNHVGDTLHMRWRKKVLYNPPAAWGVNFGDPQRNTPDISNVDSLDFELPDTTAWVTNKFVIGVDPNDEAGYAEYIFTIFELGYEADSIRIIYYVDVYSPIDLDEHELTSSLYPVPATDRLYGFESPEDIEDIRLYDFTGKALEMTIQEDVLGAYLDVSKLKSGHYLLSFRRGNDYITHKIIVE